MKKATIQGYFTVETLAKAANVTNRAIQYAVKRGKISGYPIKNTRGSVLIIPIKEGREYIKYIKGKDRHVK